MEEVLLLRLPWKLEQLLFLGKGEQFLNLRNDTWNSICCLKQLLLLMEVAPPVERLAGTAPSCFGEGYLKQLLILGIGTWNSSCC
jgi:hypothetical protein